VTVHEANWFDIFSGGPMLVDMIQCNRCGHWEPLCNAVENGWHVGQRTVQSVRGGGILQILHLCHDCTVNDDESSPAFPGVSFYRVEAF
jgi:hypothetical protein